jgi:hypothetical protein
VWCPAAPRQCRPWPTHRQCLHPSSHVLLILLFSFFIAYSFVPVCQFPDFIFHLNH